MTEDLPIEFVEREDGTFLKSESIGSVTVKKRKGMITLNFVIEKLDLEEKKFINGVIVELETGFIIRPFNKLCLRDGDTFDCTIDIQPTGSKGFIKIKDGDEEVRIRE